MNHPEKQTKILLTDWDNFDAFFCKFRVCFKFNHETPKISPGSCCSLPLTQAAPCDVSSDAQQWRPAAGLDGKPCKKVGAPETRCWSVCFCLIISLETAKGKIMQNVPNALKSEVQGVEAKLRGFSGGRICFVTVGELDRFVNVVKYQILKISKSGNLMWTEKKTAVNRWGETLA